MFVKEPYQHRAVGFNKVHGVKLPDLAQLAHNSDDCRSYFLNMSTLPKSNPHKVLDVTVASADGSCLEPTDACINVQTNCSQKLVGQQLKRQ